MRADAFVSNGFSTVFLPSLLSTSTNRDCRTRSRKPCFFVCAKRRRRYHSRCCVCPGVPLFGKCSKEQQHFMTVQATPVPFWIEQQFGHVDACLFQPRFHFFLLFRARSSGMFGGQATSQLITLNISRGQAVSPSLAKILARSISAISAFCRGFSGVEGERGLEGEGKGVREGEVWSGGGVRERVVEGWDPEGRGLPEGVCRKHHQNSTRRPPREGRKKEICGGKGENSNILGSLGARGFRGREVPGDGGGPKVVQNFGQFPF